jgi:nicotinamidase-related amidase
MHDNQSDYAPQFSLHFVPEPEKTSLLVIDMQYASAHRDTGLGRLLKERGQEAAGRYRFDRIEQVVVPHIQQLLAFFRKNRLCVIHITVGSEVPDYSDLLPHMKGFAQSVGNTASHREHDILDALKPLLGELCVNKRTMSAFNSTGIDLVLRSRGIRYVLCCGVSTNSCVAGTARDAAEHGYDTVMIEDACGAATQAYHDATLQNFKRLLGMVMNTKDVIAALKARLDPGDAS